MIHTKTKPEPGLSQCRDEWVEVIQPCSSTIFGTSVFFQQAAVAIHTHMVPDDVIKKSSRQRSEICNLFVL